MPPGDLDKTFNNTGKKTITFGGVDGAEAVLVQPNGRIVVAGGGGAAASAFCVARLRPNGTLDTTRPAGKRRVAFGGEREAAFGAALQPDGKIVLVGDSDLSDVAVARLIRTGRRTRRSRATASACSAGARSAAPRRCSCCRTASSCSPGSPDRGREPAARALEAGRRAGYDVRRQGNREGRLRRRRVRLRDGAPGERTHRRGGPVAGDVPRRPVAGRVVTRVRANGELDPDFAGTGNIMLPGTKDARAVLIQPDRKIVVAGMADGGQKMAVTRLKPKRLARPDVRRRRHGDHRRPSCLRHRRGAAADGKIVVAASGNGRFRVARLNGDGSPDAAFGIATVDFGVTTFTHAVARQPNGRIVVAGQRTVSDDFALARLLA